MTSTTNIQPKGMVIAGLSGGSGKSVVAVGIAAALTGQGLRLVTFKKGPDYIDAGWLSLAAGRPCYNLDPYLMPPAALLRSFHTHAAGADAVIIEGNRGLFDGVNVEGSYSTAELAVTLGLPVLLVVDCTKTTRTVAALVLGCRQMDDKVNIKGVVLNRLAGARHEKIVRQSVEHYTGIPVLGALPRLPADAFPQRHLGVTPHQEHTGPDKTIAMLADTAAQHMDLARVSSSMSPLPSGPDLDQPSLPRAGGRSRVCIGVLKDSAFQFYYPDNLEALTDLGAKLLEINAMTAPELPEVDALYIGGGFPETGARQLSGNKSFRESLKRRAETGLPIYAECGGLIYLGEGISLDGIFYPLAGIFPTKFGLGKKPQAHGYSILEVSNQNPFYPLNTRIKGHEFRYSNVLEFGGDPAGLAFSVKRGVGFIGGRDGLTYKNVLALYTHVHAVGTPIWAEALVESARRYKERMKDELL